ncbi:MAG: PHP domain-containing protein [Nanoarchaeota archaeon]|nr:PHP domain-containing protein [Nanoarchaeota archaeon]
MKIDLHTHTNASDGELPPEKLIDLAIQSGLKVIAITDHDTINSCQKAIEYSKNKDIEVIPGIEISCYEEEKGWIEIHIVGLFIDYHNPKLVKFCQSIKQERIKQKKEIIKKLQKLGFDITFEEAIKLASYSFGRPHLAQILVKKYPERFPDVKEVFNQFLGNGKPAYVKRNDKIRIKEAIDIIKKAGGIPILAHPGVYEQENAVQLIKFFVECGGQGIETYYSYDLINNLSEEESNKRNSFFQEYAQKNKLIQSGGSDFHGEIRKTVKLGQINIPYELINKLKRN